MPDHDTTKLMFNTAEIAATIQLMNDSEEMAATAEEIMNCCEQSGVVKMFAGAMRDSNDTPEHMVQIVFTVAYLSGVRARLVNKVN